MKIEFLVFGSRAPTWVGEAREAYATKIGGFQPFAVRTLKSPGAARDSAEVKQKLEAEILTREVREKDYLILFDERGRLARDSAQFAKWMSPALESGKSRILFVVGGPYGFAPQIKSRADQLWSLSPLTFNHWIAQFVALEQVYRGFTILRGIPYHNE